ncbi:MAG: exosortase system-associated protein, TIGR04073 family [Candidatus Omnitrophota bacterium]
MVKRAASYFMIVSVILVSTPAAYAASNDLLEGMFQKLGRGVVDVLTGWIELPAQISKGYSEGLAGDGRRKTLGAGVGIIKGISNSCGRTFSGLSDIVTFWAANPADNEGVGIPLDSDYAWQRGEPYDYFYPTFTEGVFEPMGKKFLRGLGNVTLGWAEIPGQMLKETQKGAIDLGFIKGMWYWLSRAADGFSDIFTAFLPNHVDEKGIAFEEEWPWDAASNTASDFGRY